MFAGKGAGNESSVGTQHCAPAMENRQDQSGQRRPLRACTDGTPFCIGGQ
ncbi:hypothetical protein K788_0005166 [Paraburkholderia caribensis MBA4]|uniref:Uncharacterized protein n=1 Tax=Paraburkholderia caribensis MBA4 TaxID=1323664 RepID=A0A0P0RFN3_9BURK|nr:hypothetical protein K788_0005166 [Paraburkholderia caribensis MBA4]